jgi:16S rRNA (cytosine1402-N4)-methyltransferase
MNTSENTSNFNLHIPVLLQQTVQALDIKPNGLYIDATFGRGGHSKLILQQLGHSGRLLVIDQDPIAVQHAQELANQDARVIVCQGNFKDLKSMVHQHSITSINGILFDLGVSSPQLDQADRGFSFNKDGPLDMRMDNSANSCCGYTAEQWINKATAEEIADVLWIYGEEKYSRKIAKAIVAARIQSRITRTLQLAEIIKTAHPNWPKHKHPATQSFLAIRLFINKELEVLQAGLSQAVDLLSQDGKLVVISFHSLEDRIVKNFINDHSKIKNNLLNKLPVTEQQLNLLSQTNKVLLKNVQKPLKAGIIEGDDNIRARSAILRIATKI